ncbi:MAG: DUF4785 family protein [Thermoanaerobaculia bacterium]|nr:DUF4785 family protein [Thermoanaerobaculia bacterium]
MLSFKNAILISATALVLAIPSSAADTVRLAPVQEGDLAASDLIRVLDKARPGVSREDVAFTYAVRSDLALDLRPAPFEVASREYFTDVSGDDLRRGVPIYVTAENAVVRINPTSARDKALPTIEPSGLLIRSAAGSFDKGSGMSLLVEAAELEKAGVPFMEGTTAFRLAPSVGVGEIVLQAAALESGGRYQIHVFDVESPYILGLRAGATDYLHGQTLEAAARLGSSEKTLPLYGVEAYVTSPAGRAWRVEIAPGEGGYLSVQLPLDARERHVDGLWELHVAARGSVDGLEVVRSARTAFGVHLPTAGLAGDVALTQGRSGLRADFAVQVGSPGRYEVRGVLFGTDAAGVLRPVAMGHSASWLAADGVVRLSFDRSLLDEAEVGAPFEIRDLRLLDQGRMGILHRQAIGLVVD